MQWFIFFNCLLVVVNKFPEHDFEVFKETLMQKHFAFLVKLTGSHLILANTFEDFMYTLSEIFQLCP